MSEQEKEVLRKYAVWQNALENIRGTAETGNSCSGCNSCDASGGHGNCESNCDTCSGCSKP